MICVMQSATTPDAPKQRNRRVAILLVGWIVAMAILSILVIVLR